MTKQEWVDLVNETIANERNEYAREVSARAAIRESDGALIYLDRKTPTKYERRVSLQGLFGSMHGKDIRALKAARAA